MMPQMESDGPRQEQAYRGGYGGAGEYSQQQTYQTYQQPPRANPLDDNLVEAVAERLAQRINQGNAGKIYGKQDKHQSRASAGQRLGLAIVSVVMMVPLSAIIFTSIKDFYSLAAFFIAATAIFLINAVFNALNN